MAAPLQKLGAAAIVLTLTLVSAAIGVAWLSVAIARWLEPEVGAALAAFFAGLIFVLPLAIYALNRTVDNGHERQREDPETHQLGLVASRAQTLFRDKPLLGLGLVVIGGVFLARFPGAIGLLAQALTPQDDD